MFIPTARVNDQLLPTNKMRFDGELTYGKIREWPNLESVEVLEVRKLALGLGEGLQVLLIQFLVYTTLVKICEAILSPISPAELTDDINPIKSEPPNLVGRGELMSSFAEIAATLYYQGPTGLDIGRVCRLVKSAAKAIQDHAFHLREDPGYFEDAYEDAVNHDVFMVPDEHGRTHPALQGQNFLRLTLNGIVLRSHFHLMYWQELADQMHELEKLLETYPNGIVYSELEESEVKIIDYTHFLLEEMKTLYLVELRGVCTSPGFRMHFVRDDRNIKTNPSMLKEPLLRETYMMLFSITGAYESEKIADWQELYHGLDVLETFLSRNPAARNLFSHQIEQILTKLSVLAECAFRLMIQPWYTESVYYLESDPAQYKASLMGSFQGWGKVFQTKEGLITDTDLGDPKDKKFLYPSEKSAARKPVRQALCKAERHLDDFWAMVDGNITKLCHRSQRKALRRIFDEGGAIRRTKTWDEKFPRPNQSDPPEDIFQPQPASRIFHDSSKDVTANFDKLAVTEKTKEKTRGEPGPAAVPAAQGPEPELEEKTAYKVDQNAHRVFSALFHIPDENGSVPGKVTWGEFLSALTKLGFAAEQMHGSAWEFTPTGGLEHLQRGIHFHQPHPSNEIPLKLARNFGRRLARVYDWDGTMFVLE